MRRSGLSKADIRKKSYIKHRVTRNAASRAYYHANRRAIAGVMARRHCIRKYGITLDQKVAMLISQGGLCAVCGCSNPQDDRKGWHLDHDHDKQKGDPGFVRGVVCRPCNMTIGNAQDDPRRLRLAADYLEKHT